MKKLAMDLTKDLNKKVLNFQKYLVAVAFAAIFAGFISNTEKFETLFSQASTSTIANVECVGVIGMPDVLEVLMREEAELKTAIENVEKNPQDGRALFLLGVAKNEHKEAAAAADAFSKTAEYAKYQEGLKCNALRKMSK